MLGELGKPQPYEVTWAPAGKLPQLTNSPGNSKVSLYFQKQGETNER